MWVAYHTRKRDGSVGVCRQVSHRRRIHSHESGRMPLCDLSGLCLSLSLPVSEARALCVSIRVQVLALK